MGLSTIALSTINLLINSSLVLAQDYQLVSYSDNGDLLAYVDFDSIKNINNRTRATVLWKIIEEDTEYEETSLIEFDCSQNKWRFLDTPNSQWQSSSPNAMSKYIEEAVCFYSNHAINNLSY